MTATRPGNEDLALFKKLPAIYAVLLRHCLITDGGLTYLKDMADLQYLTLADVPIIRGTKATAKGVRALKGAIRGIESIQW